MAQYEEDYDLNEIHSAYMAMVDEALAHLRNDLSGILADLIEEVREVSNDDVVVEDDDEDY